METPNTPADAYSSTTDDVAALAPPNRSTRRRGMLKWLPLIFAGFALISLFRQYFRTNRNTGIDNRMRADSGDINSAIETGPSWISMLSPSASEIEAVRIRQSLVSSGGTSETSNGVSSNFLLATSGVSGGLESAGAYDDWPLVAGAFANRLELHESSVDVFDSRSSVGRGSRSLMVIARAGALGIGKAPTLLIEIFETDVMTGIEKSNAVLGSRSAAATTAKIAQREGQGGGGGGGGGRRTMYGTGGGGGGKKHQRQSLPSSSVLPKQVPGKKNKLHNNAHLNGLNGIYHQVLLEEKLHVRSEHHLVALVLLLAVV